jgi:galactose mutarotase-like enzyme
MDLSITGLIKQTQPLGTRLELRRTISGTIGKAGLRIRDEVVNRGNTPAPHMLLYHLNFGWPLADEGTAIIWEGQWQSREGEERAKIFRQGNDFRTCPAPLDEHRGGGEEAAFIDVAADGAGQCVCGLHNPRLGLAVALRFSKSQLPWLTNWQHWGKGEYVTGLEPGTNPPVGQAKAREQQDLIILAPGESRRYDLELEVLDNEERINELVKNKR